MEVIYALPYFRTLVHDYLWYESNLSTSVEAFKHKVIQHTWGEVFKGFYREARYNQKMELTGGGYVVDDHTDVVYVDWIVLTCFDAFRNFTERTVLM